MFDQVLPEYIGPGIYLVLVITCRGWSSQGTKVIQYFDNLKFFLFFFLYG